MVGFFTFHHISHKDFELKIETPRIRRRVPKKKKTTNYSKIFLAMINLNLFSAKIKKYFNSPYNT